MDYPLGLLIVQRYGCHMFIPCIHLADRIGGGLEAICPIKIGNRPYQTTSNGLEDELLGFVLIM